MKIIICSIVLCIFISCANEDPNALLGRWELIEVWDDPGFGPVEFTQLESEKYIEFFKDNRVITNGSLCFFDYRNITDGDTGEYSLTDLKITASNCQFPPRIIRLEFEDSSLILVHSCDEKCAEKYTRVK